MVQTRLQCSRAEQVVTTQQVTAYLLLKIAKPKGEKRVLADVVKLAKLYRTIQHVFVDRTHAGCHVYLRFAAADSADRFRKAIHNKFTSTHLLSVEFLPESAYTARFQDSAQFVLVELQKLDLQETLLNQIHPATHLAGYQRRHETFVHSLHPNLPMTLVTTERYPPVLFTVLPPESQKFFQQEMAVYLKNKDTDTFHDLNDQVESRSMAHTN